MFEIPLKLKTLEREGYQEGCMREICVLPFPLGDALIQGETKELCLYEERFHKLFQKSTIDHGGVVAMGLLAPPGGILQSMPLCEVESYQTMDGDTGFGTSFSILATIRVVGRASLAYIDDNEESEFLTGWCTELFDDTLSENGRIQNGKDIPESANKMADRCEEVFESIIELESKISLVKDDFTDVLVDTEATSRRKRLEEELQMGEIYDDDDEVDDFDDDDDDDDSDYGDNTRSRLLRAFKIAKSSDAQGYRISSNDSLSNGSKVRSIQDLTALSWAYFCMDPKPENLVSFRLRSLEIVELTGRLKLALVMLMERRSELRAVLRASTTEIKENRMREDDEDDDIVT